MDRYRRAVFIDRDGVVNSYAYNSEFGTVDTPANPGELTVLPLVGEAVAALNRLGFLVIVASNQPGIAKRKFTAPLLKAVTDKMHAEIGSAGGHLDAVYYCLHHPESLLPEYQVDCNCRKPKTGLFLQAAQDWNIDLTKSYTVGDGVADLVAGGSAGTLTIFVSSRKCYICDELRKHGVRPDLTVSSLFEAAETISRLEQDSIPTVAHHVTIPCMGQLENKMTYTALHLQEAAEILRRIDQVAIERTVDLLVKLREQGGRLFLLGVGGGAGHASHAVCDFRKIAHIEAYSPSDNVSELTARVNDEGWDTAYANWLRGSHLSSKDMIFVFSVGGGDAERNISANLVQALRYASEVGARICGVVGRDGGYTARVADVCVLIPVVNPASVTPHTESIQAMVWHLIVSHPALKEAEMKWESVRPDRARTWVADSNK